MSTLATITRVAEHLRTDAGLVASVEYPGYVAIPVADGSGNVWAFGDINETWDGQLLGPDGDHLGLDNITFLDIPHDCEDASRIALAIARALLEHYE